MADVAQFAIDIAAQMSGAEQTYAELDALSSQLQSGGYRASHFEEAIKRRGFRFIEVIAPCSTLYARLNKLGTGYDLLKYYYDNSEIQHGADTRDLGIDFQGKMICGKFIDEDKPTYNELMDAHYQKILGDRYMPMSPEGGWIRE